MAETRSGRNIWYRAGNGGKRAAFLMAAHRPMRHASCMSNTADDLSNQVFSIPSEEETCVREARDWMPCEPKIFVFHVPTRAMFELFPDPGKRPEDALALTDFRTRLVHLCEGASVPEVAELQKLGREALLMGLHHIGLVELCEPSKAKS